MSSKGQTINDRLNAAKYTIAGLSLPRIICKATTEEMLQPKKKHLDYLAACTYETDTSMVQFANQLIERTNHSNWVVVYKALITVHHLMSFGSERFTQYLASSNYTFKPNGFHDKIITKGYNMSTYIRRYAIYINQKSLSYRGLAVDLCRKQRTKEKILRTMPIERLLETLPIVHKQLDALLNFDCSPDDLSNSIIVACFRLLFHDAIRLFASYNDGIINLFEKYFDLNKKMCREAFEAYKKFLDCADRVYDFLKVAETINLDRGDIPDFKRAPSSLLQALEQHLVSLESNKRDKSIVISAKNVTIPSFSANLDLEPSLSMVLKGYESTIQPSSSNDQICEEAVEAIDALSKMVPPPSSSNESNQQVGATTLKFSTTKSEPVGQQTRLTQLSLASGNSSRPTVQMFKVDNFSNNNSASIESKFDPALESNRSIDELFGDTKPKPQQQQYQTQQQHNNFDSSGEHSNINNNNVSDYKPPGFCDGSLLTPEFSIQTRFDPSIDLQTQQQLIQIQREQAALKRKQLQSPELPTSQFSCNNNHVMLNAINTNNNQSSFKSKNYNSNIQNKLKSKPESIFEDLEKSMRQSLQTEK